MKGKGQGWRNESHRHRLAGMGIKTTPIRMKAKGLPKDVDVSRRYWSLSINNKKEMSLSLGNLSDAGWFWNGDETELSGFLIRIEKSKVTEEFIQDMKDDGVKFKDLKPLILASLEEPDGNGMYQLTGDNQIWHFGYGWDLETDHELDYYEENYGKLSEKDRDEINNKYWIESQTGKSVNYDEFEKSEQYNEIKKELKEIIIESDTFEDYFKSIERLDESSIYPFVEWSEEIDREEFSEAFYNWKAEKEKEGRKFEEK